MPDFTPKVFSDYGGENSTVYAADLTAMGAEIEEQEQQLTAHDTQLTAHDTQLTNHDTRITGVETGLAQANTDIGTLETNLGQTNTLATGKYTKPADGIPKTDLTAAVQTSLGKADTATQPRTTVIQEFISTIGNPVNLTNQPVPKGAIGVRLTMIPPGSGGGSGRRGAPGTVRCGGGGAAPSRPLFDFFVPVNGGTTFDIKMDAPGLGGASVTADNTNGNSGTRPAECHLVLGGKTIRVLFPTGLINIVGKLGTGASGAGGSAFSPDMPAGGSASTSGGIGGDGTSSFGMYPAAGGSGGGITTANAANNGGLGGYNRYLTTSSNESVAGGVVDGALPGVGMAAVAGIPGHGGAGGAASITQDAQAGADGVGYGSPGGGGGASTNGFASGRGGNGGPGFARLEWVFS